MDARRLIFAGWVPGSGHATEAVVSPEQAGPKVQGHSGEILRMPPRVRKVRDKGAVPTLDEHDPTIGKWAAVVLEEDAAQAAPALEPLLARRRAQGWAFPAGSGAGAPGLVVMRRPKVAKLDRWKRSLSEAVEGRPPPKYLLLVGGPDRFSFEWQYDLNVLHCVGRLDVGDAPDGPLSWAACRTWAEKMVRYESGKLAVAPKALLYSFATDEATRRSHEDLATPIHEHLASAEILQKLRTRIAPSLRLFGRDATTARLVEALGRERPALVLTASHGLEFPRERLLWGALTDSTFVGADGEPLSARTIPQGGAFAPGAVVLSFACFSAGVPAESAVRFLMDRAEQPIPGAPFTSPLARALLAHPEGPVAFVGHVDRATTGSFQAEGSRAGPVAFLDFVDWSLGGFGTLGKAMSTFRESFAAAARRLGALLWSTKPSPAVDASKDVVDAWVRYHDAVGYVLLGDPALRVSDALSGG